MMSRDQTLVTHLHEDYLCLRSNPPALPTVGRVIPTHRYALHSAGASIGVG